MPLACDCYGGCWGVHSRGWPSIEYSDEIWRRCVERLPYGSYVHFTAPAADGSEETWRRWVGKPSRAVNVIRIEGMELLGKVIDPLPVDGESAPEQ